MTDIASKLNSILTAKNDIKQAVIDKGGSFNSVSSFAEYADAIRAIPTTNPSGTLTIKADGEYDVTNYAKVKVEARQYVNVYVTVTHRSTSVYGDYVYSNSGLNSSNQVTSSNYIKINNVSLSLTTRRTLGSAYTHTVQVPANSTVTWTTSSPFYIQKPGGGSVVQASSLVNMGQWYVNGVRTSETSGSFQVTDGDYSLVLACSG